MDTSKLEIYTEQIDDIPLLFGFARKMGIQETLDAVIIPHGNWQGLSVGWVVLVWLVHILSKKNHCMDGVREWVVANQVILSQLVGEPIRELDFTDDRLALCLSYLSKNKAWQEIEAMLGRHLIRVYELEGGNRVRLDATTASVNHDPETHSLFKVGKAKNGLYETQYKMMLASLDPLGLVLAVDVVSGEKADDPLYLPCYQRAKETLKRDGLLIIGDSKMNAVLTRATIQAEGDYYLTPSSNQELLAQLLEPVWEKEQETSLIFLPEELPEDESEPNPEFAIGEGFVTDRIQAEWVDERLIIWLEQCHVVRSYSYVKVELESLQRRLEKAEAELRKLTPARSRGKRQIKDEASLLSRIEAIEKKYRVKGLFDCSYTQEVAERRVRGYKGKVDRVERRVRFQLSVQRNKAAVTRAEDKTGWRIYWCNASTEQLSTTDVVLAYREQYIEENIFRRLKGAYLSISPLYIQLDEHAKGLFHLLTLAARLLALGDYTAKRALAEEGGQLSGIYAGNPKRSTARPTTERMLRTFQYITFTMLMLSGLVVYTHITPLTPVQQRILDLLDLPADLYTRLTKIPTTSEQAPIAPMATRPSELMVALG